MGALFSVSHRWEYISPWGEGGVAAGWAKQVTYECKPGNAFVKHTCVMCTGWRAEPTR